MATAKKAPAKKAAAKSITKIAPKAAAKTIAAAPLKPVITGPLKPIKTAFNKSSLAAHVAEQSGVDAKSAKAVLAALEGAIVMSVNKKGLGSFTLPGLLKVTVQNVPAKKKRMGKDPFTGVERMFAAKPASVKIKTRALKKLKDAAL